MSLSIDNLRNLLFSIDNGQVHNCVSAQPALCRGVSELELFVEDEGNVNEDDVWARWVEAGGKKDCIYPTPDQTWDQWVQEARSYEKETDE